MLDNGLSHADLRDAEASPFLGGSTPERSKLFGSRGQRSWFHEVMMAITTSSSMRVKPRWEGDLMVCGHPRGQVGQTPSRRPYVEQTGSSGQGEPIGDHASWPKSVPHGTGLRDRNAVSSRHPRAALNVEPVR